MTAWQPRILFMVFISEMRECHLPKRQKTIGFNLSLWTCGVLRSEIKQMVCSDTVNITSTGVLSLSTCWSRSEQSCARPIRSVFGWSKCGPAVPWDAQLLCWASLSDCAG